MAGEVMKLGAVHLASSTKGNKLGLENGNISHRDQSLAAHLHQVVLLGRVYYAVKTASGLGVCRYQPRAREKEGLL
jgi:hypothetical protein